MNIGLAYNIKKSKPSKDLTKQKDLEFDSQSVIDAIRSALESLGNSVVLIEADENSFLRLKGLKGKIDIVFNIAEGLWGDARESQIPIFCEVLQIPYTHSGPTTHGIGLDKSFTKLVLKGADHINVPESHVVIGTNYAIPDYLHFPLIVKPNKEGSSKGVFDANVVNNQEDLEKRIAALTEGGTSEVLVEEYIDGREFTVAVLGNKGNFKVLPIIEQKFDFLPKGMNKIASFELKWMYEDSLKDLGDAYDCPAKIDLETKEKIEETSRQVCDLLDVRECSRIDYRLNDDDKLYFIEINTLPGINPDESIISYFPLAARTAGMTYKELIAEILDLACKRYNLR
jgi:D-alanine-D-alanine ligase